MNPIETARRLEDQAKVLRSMAAGIQTSGHPIEVVMSGKPCPLNQLTSLDLIDDASALEADAAKLRSLYNN